MTKITAKLREKSKEELEAELEKNLQDGFKLRLQKSTGQLKTTHMLKATRRSIARIKTLLTSKK